MHKGKMTVTDVSRLSGVSVRALRYYDRLGLLRPGIGCTMKQRLKSFSRYCCSGSLNFRLRISRVSWTARILTDALRWSSR